MSDFGIDLPAIRTTGRAPSVISMEIAGSVTEGDLELLALPRPHEQGSLKKLRDSHHALARLVASGMKGAEISNITGYSQPRISVLKDDPAFLELVEFYRSEAQRVNPDTIERLNLIALDGLQAMHERILDDENGQIALEALLKITTAALDRSGHGPQSKSQNVNVNVDIASRMEAGRRRAEALRRPVIEPDDEQ